MTTQAHDEGTWKRPTFSTADLSADPGIDHHALVLRATGEILGVQHVRPGNEPFESNDTWLVVPVGKETRDEDHEWWRAPGITRHVVCRACGEGRHDEDATALIDSMVSVREYSRDGRHLTGYVLADPIVEARYAYIAGSGR